MCDEKTVEYLRDLIAEKQTLQEHIAEAFSNNRNNTSIKDQPEHRPTHQHGEHDTNQNVMGNSCSSNSSSDTQSTSCGTRRSIAQRLLDQGQLVQKFDIVLFSCERDIRESILYRFSKKLF